MLEKHYKSRQTQREKRWYEQGERIIHKAYPPMAGYYAVAAYGWKYLMGFMLVAAVFMLLYFVGCAIWENGFTSTFNDFKEMMAAFQWHHGVTIILFVIFFAGLFAVSPILIRYVENTETIFTNKCVYIKRYLRKVKIVTYEEIKECIKWRKIRIENGRYMIPYKGGSIPVEMIAGEFPTGLFALLEKKCNIDLPSWDINHRAQRSGVGWACGTLGGGIAAVFAVFIWIIIFVTEGVYTWERAFFDFFTNPMLWFVVGLVSLGLLFRIYFWPSTVLAYRQYKEVIKVSVMPIFIDMLVVWVLAGGYMHYSAMPILEEQAVVEEVSMSQTVSEPLALLYCGPEAP